MAKEPDRTEAHSATRGAQESAHRSWWRGVFENNLRRFRNREERERYMDSLEWQMEDQREQIQHTLEQTTEDSDRRRKALEKLRSFPGRTPVRGAPVREEPIEPIGSETPSAGEESPRKRSEPRSWWRRMFGGS
jgi:thioester reductase-like protein